MKKTTHLIAVMLSITLCASSIIFACKKKKDPAPSVETDPKIELIRAWITKQSGYDLTGIKPEITFGDLEKRDEVGPFKGENFFTLEMAQSLDKLVPEQRQFIDTKPYVTRTIRVVAERFGEGNLWTRYKEVAVRPAEGNETFAALAVAGESVADLLGGEHKLWRVQFIVPKK